MLDSNDVTEFPVIIEDNSYGSTFGVWLTTDDFPYHHMGTFYVPEKCANEELK